MKNTADEIRVGIVAFGLDRPATGIARYAKELIQALRALDAEIRLFLIKPFDEPIENLVVPEVEHRLFGARRLHGMVTAGAIQLGFAARQLNLDVIHDPIGIAPFILPRPIARFGRLLTIHDAAPFVYPETASAITNILFKRYIPCTLRFVDRIVTDSDSSKRDIERYYGAPSHMVDRVYCGVSSKFVRPPGATIDRVLKTYRIPSRYLLAVGAPEPRKNIETLLRAFADLRSLGMSHSLVIVGYGGRNSERIQSLLRQLKLEGSVIFTAYVSDQDLPSLYAGADCLVFPSVYEGFGLPPLEAMSCGTPVITSNSSSLPEVVGDAGIMVDAHDVDGFTRSIHAVLTQPGLAEELKMRGLVRAKQFSWSRAAEEHLRIYRQLATRRGMGTG